VRELRDLLEAIEARYRPSGNRLWERELLAGSVRAGLELVRRKEAQPRGPFADPAGLAAIGGRLLEVRASLQAQDRAEFAPLQERLERGEYAPEHFFAELQSRPRYSWDAFVERLFDISEVPRRESTKQAEMIKYQATPWEAIERLLPLLGADDVLYDLGSGLGKVTLLAGWLTAARARGIEYDPAYALRAKTVAERFRFPRVEMIEGDVRSQDLSPGNVFYFYYPFEGSIMREVLDRLAALAATKRVRIVTFGKCTSVFLTESWLNPILLAPDGFAHLESRPA
jgi:hypothetical protein